MKFREELYGTGNPTRKHAMAVASLLGHSGPSVSMEHYIHCMDWLLNAFLAQSLLMRVPSTRQAIIASARPASALYTKGAEILPQCPCQCTRYKATFRTLRLLRTTPTMSMPAREAAPQDAGASWVRNTWDLLFQSSRSNDPLDSLAEELGLDSASARLIFGRAIKIQNITAPRGRRSKPHSMKNVAINKESAEQDCLFRIRKFRTVNRTAT